MANIQAIIQTIQAVIQVASAAIQAGKDVAPFAKAIVDTFKGGTKAVTQEQLDALMERVRVLHDELQEPLPPPTEDELR